MGRRDFLTLLDFAFSFHHTPNLGFWPKLAIQTNHNFMSIMGDGLRKLPYQITHDNKGEMGRLGKPLSGSASSSQLTE
ncbi:hypothetical protein H5410_040645 [Solanum commersonii]|uniref:Uncharacterized protein n=1 Tax=Solanum commersonii TaxID=4109 RepID=A0A9J5XPE8_SOLCO|nr:hypothetical protein H5410_040645 [Solanum commersonii]